MSNNREQGLADILANIPLVHAMQIRVANYADRRLELSAPARPSMNHIGIAFGGAIECLGTLAGWGLLWLALDDPGMRIVIQHADTTFKAPLEGDLQATATLPEPSEWKRFTALLERRARARINIRAEIGGGDQAIGAVFHGRYAVARHNPD